MNMGCVPIPVLPWVYLKEVHYLYYPYSLEYANFSDVSAVPIIEYSVVHLPEMMIATAAARHPPKTSRFEVWNKVPVVFKHLLFSCAILQYGSVNAANVENAPTSSSTLPPPDGDRQCYGRCYLLYLSTNAAHTTAAFKLYWGINFVILNS